MRKSLKRWLIPMSAAMIALLSAGTVLAADTVSVKVENTPGGYINAYYKDANNNRHYLPVGENVEIPKGSEVEYTAWALNYTPNGNNEYQGVVLGVDKVIGSNVYEAEKKSQSRNRQRGTIVADSDMSIKGTFKAFSISKDDDEDEDDDSYNPRYELCFKDTDGDETKQINKLYAGTFSEQLYLWDDNNYKIHPFDSEITAEILEVEGDDIDEDPIDNLGICFSIDKNGKLTSSKKLEEGEYRIRGTFNYKGETGDINLTVDLGAKVYIEMPIIYYKESESSSTYSEEANFVTEGFVGDPSKITFNDTLVWAKRSMYKLAGHEVVGIGERNNTTLKNIGTNKVSTKVSEKYPVAYVYAMYNNYTAPIVEHLTKDDVIPEKVNIGWNKINDEWYYYSDTSYRSLVKNQWVPCRDNDGENVWVGADGKVVSNAVVTDGADKYLVDAKGHKLCNKTGYTLGNVDYTTDENGKITGSKLHLATPSDAAKADQFVKDVMDNMNSLSQEDKEKAADMTTEALQKKVDTSKLTKEEMKQYADLYRAVYGESSIEINGSDDNDAMIVAAGLTSKDFAEDGSVEIELKDNWLATSSNAVKVELALYVNGKARALNAPVKVEVELPEKFVASYSNASYNFSVSPKPVSYEIKDGKLIITIAKADTYTVQATKKSSGGSSSGGGSSHSYTSHAVSKAVQAGYKASNGKSGNWILDNKGWWFKYQDGTWPKSEWLEIEWNNVKSWYYFGADGYMVTGWYQDGGKWYYLHPKADGTRGYMYTGWHQIGNNWYYFRVTAGGPKGSLVVNATTPDGYKVNENGEWVK